jgi:hypothetical protein
MGRLELTDGDIKEIIRLYSEEDKSTLVIGALYDTSKVTINRLLKKHGVVLHIPGRRWEGGKNEASKRYTNKNKERLSEYHKEWSKINRGHLQSYHQQWRDNNREHVNEKKRTYEKNRKDIDPHYRLSCYTRTAVYTCLKENNISKYRSTFELLPFTLESLITHLEKQFTEGMCWDNYGEWHLDHILPMNSFDFDEENSFSDCWSLANLQPLWSFDNLSKGSKVL